MTLPAAQSSMVMPVDVRNPLVEYATKPWIYNIPVLEVDTEYSQALPANTKKFLIHSQDGTEFRLAFESGRVVGSCPLFFTVPANTAYNEDFIKVSNLSLYFAGICSVGICPSLTMEIIAWT